MNVIICDDQALIRDGLEMLLNLEPDIQVVGVRTIAPVDCSIVIDVVLSRPPMD